MIPSFLFFKFLLILNSIYMNLADNIKDIISKPIRYKASD